MIKISNKYSLVRLFIDWAAAPRVSVEGPWIGLRAAIRESGTLESTIELRLGVLGGRVKFIAYEK